MHSVTLACYEYNHGARRLYENAGFTLDGRLRDRVYFDRKWHAMLEFSMLETEWEALRGAH
jgi:RimJ/RimL family protein N-acetyltransferase